MDGDNDFLAFLIELSTNETLVSARAEFEALVESSGLSPQQKAILLSGDQDAIRDEIVRTALGDDVQFVLVTMFP